jgi:predicted PurR-regulated permease PerM
MTPISQNRRNAGFKALLVAACLVVVIGGLKLAAGFIIPILLGLFLAVLSLPISHWLQSRRVPLSIAVLATVVVDLLVLGALVFLIVTIMPDFQASIGKYDIEFRRFLMVKVTLLQQTLTDTAGPLQTWFNQNFGDPAETDPPAPIFDLRRAAEQMLSVSSLMSLINWNTSILNVLVSWMTKSFFAFVLMVFILAEADKFSAKAEHMAALRGPNFRLFRDTTQQMQRYLVIKTLASVVKGVVAGGVCALCGLEFAVVWGLMVFLFNYVPTIGALVSAIPPIILALVKFGAWPAVGLALAFLTIHTAVGNFIEPAVMGRGFGISTTVVILSVVFWGWLWGAAGMFLAIPLTMMFKVMVDGSDDFRWVGIAMSKNPDQEFEILTRPRSHVPAPRPDPDPDPLSAIDQEL